MELPEWLLPFPPEVDERANGSGSTLVDVVAVGLGGTVGVAVGKGVGVGVTRGSVLPEERVK